MPRKKTNPVTSDDKAGASTTTATKKKGRPTKRAAKQTEEEKSEEPKVKQKKSAANTEEENSKNDKAMPKTVLIKGRAAVDSECDVFGETHVYCEENDIYDGMLNQTDVTNNNNKYYILQLLKHDCKSDYYVWFRWGRVGKKGQTSLNPFGSNLDKAKACFTKKFQEKTKNKWENREQFEKVKGKYDLLKIDYNTEEAENEGKKEKAKTKLKEKVQSCLEEKLQVLMNLIFNVEEMEATVMEMQYDAKKAPLGKLTTDQIKSGYIALKKVEECISSNDFGQKLIDACNEFYTRIPHDFGMKRPPIIRSLEIVHAKVEMLEALADIEIAMKLMKDEISAEHQLDRLYKSLECTLKALERDHSDFKMIEEYLQNTHGGTHKQYKLNLSNVFEVDRKTEKDNFRDVGNKMLLWHGSRLTNFAGILKQGLRIAPPEAPVTGYMFDKGIYFADISSKSANYCYPTRNSKRGLMLLCEVSLGNQNKLRDSNYNASKMPAGHHSVMGLGCIAPDSKEQKQLSNGTVVPMGKCSETGTVNKQGYTLQYNEYIVYDPKQVRIRYLLDLDFNFV